MKNSVLGLRTFPSLLRVIGLSISLAFCIGCVGESTEPLDNRLADMVHLDRASDTSDCTSTSAILQVNQNLTLLSRNSEARFQSNSVLLPTLVSFSICNLDTSLFNLSTKAAVFGPLPLLQLLQPMEIRLNAVDAGLNPNTQNESFRLYRQNDLTGAWDFVFLGQMNGNEVRYGVTRFGKYIVTLASAVIDTTWNIIGLIPPGGGTLNLLTSSLVIPPGAVNATTPISFRITNTSPQGLPGSTNRVYDFGPDGTVFNVPVTLHVSFEDAGINEERVRPLRFYYYNNANGSWERQPTDVDWRNGRFVVTLSHFSRYAFGR